MNQSALQQLEQRMIERYTKRLGQFGRDPRTLGWDTTEHQQRRFAAALELVRFEQQRILDIGCGFSDFYAFLRQHGVQPAAYHGIDINASLLTQAQQVCPTGTFERRNILLEPYEEPVSDVTVMFGVLNLRLRGPSNEPYATQMIQHAWVTCRRALVVDMLSAYRTPAYPEEDFVFYYEPERMLRVALSLTPNVMLKHDSPPIPQKEFLLVLRK
jgi:SAM-dependent methyltransferase